MRTPVCQSRFQGVIISGGGGERLWPLSRKNRPKQCISLDGHQTLIQRSYQIAEEIVGANNVFISTRQSLVPIISQQLPDARFGQLTTETASERLI